MKIVAKRDFEGQGRVQLHCIPHFSAPYVVYACWCADGWYLVSGRRCSDKMLDAIDRLSGIQMSYAGKT